MNVIALGLTAGLAYGVMDFCAGLASRRTSSLSVVALLHVAVLIAFTVTVLLIDETPAGTPLVWGAAGGVAIGVGNIAYFRGLAAARMGIVSAITAICAALVPLFGGFVLGERPRAVAWIGIFAILVAIVLLTATGGVSSGRPGQAGQGSGIAEAGIAGLGFGWGFIALSRAAEQSGAVAWPLLAAAATGVLVVVPAALLRSAMWRPALAQWFPISAAALLYAGGSWAFMIGTYRGWLSIVSVLVALSPVATVLLARVLLGEHLSPAQLSGVAAALAGITFVAMGAPV